MHRQQSIQTLRALQVAACHFLLNVILFIVAVTIIAAGVLTGTKLMIWYGTAMITVWALSCVIFFCLSLAWYCPLCLGKLWIKTGCRRHRKATAAFGLSYRLHIALAIVFKKRYRCPYCGESFSTRKAHR